jgi:hypothetical protein
MRCPTSSETGDGNGENFLDMSETVLEYKPVLQNTAEAITEGYLQTAKCRVDPET